MGNRMFHHINLQSVVFILLGYRIL